MNARVLDASIFPILKAGIDNFVDQCPHNVDEAERVIAAMRNELAKIGEQLRQRLDQATIVLSNANMKLNLCESQPPHYDEDGEAHYPSCSSEKHDVRVAQEQVKAAENAMNKYNELIRIVEQHEAEYRSYKNRLNNMIDNVLRVASTEMQRQKLLMEEYLGTSVSGTLPYANSNSNADFHPILRPFVPSVADLVAAFGNIDDMWQDKMAEIFKSEIVKRWKKDTKDYMISLMNLAKTYESALEVGKELLADKGDFNGGWINIYQLEMIVKRKISRWFTGRDDFRF